MENYEPQKIEKKWQDFWQKEKLYQADDFSKKPKYYVLIEFPYPSGQGLHVGHCRPYCALDAVARKKRMEGYNVLFPIGWDAFGLPAENFALKTGIHPSKTTAQNIANYTRQIKSLGLSFDWSREIKTTDTKYYKWTQWIFLQLFKKGLAYQTEIPINWCPSCKIGLANEEVVAGKCERCGALVSKKTLKQWLLKITKYADRLIDDLKKVDYLEKVKTQQINWIGRSEGATIKFPIPNSQFPIEVFTTRLDTIFGVTALVLAPEHPFVASLLKIPNPKSQIPNYQEIINYIEQSKKKSEFERTELEKEKTGVFTGSYCLNPVNNEKVPIWIGDYVVATYGGGAVMVVPAHDKRDFEFAKRYKLEIREVITENQKSKIKNQNEAFVDDGLLINSEQFSGLGSEEAREKIEDWLEKKGLAKKAIHYKLRDWIFSRQHYWGEPIPIIHCPKCGAVPVPEKDLPVELPYIEKYQPTGTGESPLAKIEEWVNVACPECGGPAKRETDTMPNWAGSSWYFMRYCDPNNEKALADKKKLKYWMPVDWYNGGFEHTTLHLLYSRFWYKFLYDIDAAPDKEPYQRRTSHGIILASDGRKMSKSFGNVINPDEIIQKYGADTLRVYEMFIGPFDQAIAWDEKGVKGVYKFLQKVWKIFLKTQTPASAKAPAGKQNSKLNILLHQTIKKINDDLESCKFNTAVSALMILVNEMEKQPSLEIRNLELVIKLIAPLAPHLAEELWSKLGHQESIFKQKWPEYKPELAQEKKITLVVQINGKMRHKIEVKKDISQEQAEKLTLEQERVKKWLEDKEIKKIIFVPNKLINIVI